MGKCRRSKRKMKSSTIFTDSMGFDCVEFFASAKLQSCYVDYKMTLAICSIGPQEKKRKKKKRSLIFQFGGQVSQWEIRAPQTLRWKGAPPQRRRWLIVIPSLARVFFFFFFFAQVTLSFRPSLSLLAAAAPPAWQRRGGATPRGA